MIETSFKGRAVLGVAAAASMLLAGAAQAALLDRDLDGDAVVDAFYDTNRDITWLRNANVNGAIDWNSAFAWADGLSIGGHGDWRLPSMGTCDVNTGCHGVLEMVQLWGELGAGTGDFQNLGGYYWSGTVLNIDPNQAWYFHYAVAPITYTGYYFTSKEVPLLAMAVHPGDIGAPIPEPESLALMLAGLTALAWVVRRRRR